MVIKKIKKTFLKKIKTVFSPYIKNYEPPEPDPDTEGLDIEVGGSDVSSTDHTDLVNVLPTQHHSNSNDPTTDQKAAMTGANSPDASNVFATMADAGAGGQTLYDAIVAPSGGDYTTIQAAIDAGHTTIFVRNGTYSLSAKIDLTDKCIIVGESMLETILDMGNAANDIFAIDGSLDYSTGTISINSGSNTVTGVGTTFISAFIGKDILLGIFGDRTSLYKITAVNSTTELEIESNYYGNNLSGVSYEIYTLKSVKISNLTLKNVGVSPFSANGIDANRVKDCVFENLFITDSSSNSTMTAIDCSACFNSILRNITVNHTRKGFNFGASCIKNEIVNNFITKCYNTSSGRGIDMSNSSSQHNIISNNQISHCGTDGLYISSPYNLIANNVFSNNANTGIQILSSSYGSSFLNNHIKHNVKEGIEINHCNDITIKGNTLWKNLDGDNNGSIYCHSTSSRNIISENIINLGNFGIQLNNVYKCLVSGNYIYNPDSDGILVTTDSDNNALTMNYIFQAGGWGINIAAATELDSFVHGNYFMTCASGGLQDNGTTTTASDNVTK